MSPGDDALLRRRRPPRRMSPEVRGISSQRRVRGGAEGTAARAGLEPGAPGIAMLRHGLKCAALRLETSREYLRAGQPLGSELQFASDFSAPYQ